MKATITGEMTSAGLVLSLGPVVAVDKRKQQSYAGVAVVLSPADLPGLIKLLQSTQERIAAGIAIN